MNQVYAGILQSMIGHDVSGSTMHEALSTYPVLFEKLATLTNLDGSNQAEVSEFTSLIFEAFSELKQSELYQNPLLYKIFRAFEPVSRSYGLHGPTGMVAANSNGNKEFTLRFDTALWITIMGLMCGLKDLNMLAQYSNFANQYLQLLLPAMLHPRYRLSPANCQTVMRLVGRDLLYGYYNNFFVRAKVATKFAHASALHAIEPRLIKLKQQASMQENYATSAFNQLSNDDLPPYLASLGLDHGLILGARPLLFLCAQQISDNGYDYLLSLNHLPPERLEILQNRLAMTSNSKILIDSVENYYDALDEITKATRSVVCIKRLDAATQILECFYFISSLEPVELSLYLIAEANNECEVALKQPCSYLMTICKNKEEIDNGYLPQRESYNAFIVDILSYERELTAHIEGMNQYSNWQDILERNGNNPIFALVSMCYYFLSDLISERDLHLMMRNRLLKAMATQHTGIF